ncbi:MAG: hypothetical protein AB203_01805 [Parcubacteria bacterium C7867-008]|nr:MAG: hypothetical protein AB203_01805 [Parcubacteria bacterium C7867-008]
MEKSLISKEKFLAYESVRQSGRTNMFDTIAVEELALDEEGVQLNREEILEIMGNYAHYRDTHIGIDTE